MRILLVHNYYGSGAPSGENVVFDLERSLLEKYGHHVEVYTRNSDEILDKGILGVLRGAVAVPWNPFSGFSIRKVLKAFQPNVVHVHNTFPLISPSIFHYVGYRAAKVLTLHNYRLLCPAAIPMRAGKVCTECIDRRSVLPALRYGCYRGSRLATFPMAANVALHRNALTWQRKVDAFIALSEFQKTLMAQGGLPFDKIHVKPNFYSGNPIVIPYGQRSGGVVFVGRLSKEKGVTTLIDAWKSWGEHAPQLTLVGDGPLKVELQNKAIGLRVRFLGQVSSVVAQEEIANAKLLVLPSEWFEGFPMVVREAFAFGTPVAASNIGPLPDIVRQGECGVLFSPTDAEKLKEVLDATLSDEILLNSLSAGARLAFDKLYNETANYDILINTYLKAIERNRV